MHENLFFLTDVLALVNSSMMKLRFKDGIVLETAKYYCNNLLKILKNIYLNNIKKVNRARELSI
jgi:hypothetical protein